MSFGPKDTSDTRDQILLANLAKGTKQNISVSPTIRTPRSRTLPPRTQSENRRSRTPPLSADPVDVRPVRADPRCRNCSVHLEQRMSKLSTTHDPGRLHVRSSSMCYLAQPHRPPARMPPPAAQRGPGSLPPPSSSSLRAPRTRHAQPQCTQQNTFASHWATSPSFKLCAAS